MMLLHIEEIVYIRFGLNLLEVEIYLDVCLECNTPSSSSKQVNKKEHWIN